MNRLIDVGDLKSEADVVIIKMNSGKTRAIYTPHILFGAYAGDKVINAGYFFEGDTKEEVEAWVNKQLNLNKEETKMSEAKRVTIQSVEVSGPTPRKSGKGSYMLYKVTTTAGDVFTLFGNQGSSNPTVNKQEVTGLVAGANAQLIFERNGKFLNVLAVEVIDAFSEGVASSPVQPSSVKASITESNSTNTSGSRVTISKDLSMELSGLMQSLISTGNYHNTQPKTLDSGKIVETTYLNEKLLKTHMRLALAAKDEIAAERGAS